MEWIIPILSLLLGSGGVWALLAARATAKATETAAQTKAAPAAQQATTADWTALMGFWQAELASLRESANRLEVRVLYLEHQREDDLDHIDALEQHIWAQLPPPPPSRRQGLRKEEA